MHAHPAGALWLPESETVIIADVHLGYSWAQRRRGADFRTREKLFALCDELHPAQIVFLGDLVHARRPCSEERAWLEETLNRLAQCAHIIAVRGNHDRAFAKEFGHLPLTHSEAWCNAAITAVHGDRLASAAIPEHAALVLGHLHPCLGVRDAAGATQKLPVFLVSPHCIVLPAFSPFARGYDIACGFPADIENCFRHAPIQAYVATPTRVAHLGSLSSAIERLYESDSGAPSRFRRYRAV